MTTTTQRMTEQILQFAKIVRHESTASGHMLRVRVRAERLPEFKFKRQQTIGEDVVDLVCPEQRAETILAALRAYPSPQPLSHKGRGAITGSSECL